MAHTELGTDWLIIHYVMSHSRVIARADSISEEECSTIFFNILSSDLIIYKTNEPLFYK